MKLKAIKTLKASLEVLNLLPTEEQLLQLETYIDLLQEWNKRMNLVSDASDNILIHKHIIDSVVVASNHPEEFSLQGKKLLDAGSGAGLPGLILRIIFPTLRTVLVESRQKKCQFLQEVISTLQLKNLKVINDRLENLAHLQEFRERFDIVVARALGNLTTAAELCLPFTKRGGFFVAFKSQAYKPELDEAMPVIKLLGGELFAIHEFLLPRTQIARALLYFKKITPTPLLYPRRCGIPQKRPLKVPTA